MKKTLAVLAVLAVAAVAQAELLATWTIASGAQSDVINEKPSQISFDKLVANGLNTTFNSAQWRANNWAGTGEATGTLDASFTLIDNATFTLESVTSTLNGGGNPAPAQFAWYKGNTAITDVQGFTASRTPTDVTWNGNGAGVWTSPSDDLLEGTLSLKANGNASNGSATAASTSWTSIQTTKLYGTVVEGGSAVPEPATMSLLGLGALAMALRRKLRK